MNGKSGCLAKKERWFWITLALVLAVLNGYQFWGAPVPEQETPVSRTPETPPVQPDSATSGNAESSVTRTPESGVLSDYHRRQFQRRGLANPEADILADLLKKPHLIPQEPVLGGTMFFLPGEVRLLSERWAMATYEDGHVQGRALFEYLVSPQGNITWRVLATVAN